MSDHSEDYRLKRLADLAAGVDSVIDLGYSQSPNPFLNNPQVVGLDIDPGPLPANYTNAILCDCTDSQAAAEVAPANAVIAGEIIEHMEDPLAFLLLCYTLLKPGGRIILSTPNPNSPIERLLTIGLSRRWFYTADHLMLFPQRWLIRMLEHCGFIDVRLYSGGFPVPFLGLAPFPRPWCYQTIAVAHRPSE